LLGFITLRYVYKNTINTCQAQYFIKSLIASTCFGSYYAILRLYKIL
jgi:hypothetical protein